MKKNEITYANLLFCLLVISIHCLSEPVGKGVAAAIVPQKLISFAMQGFVFLAGVKLCLKARLDVFRFYTGRMKKLIIPYVFWVAVHYARFVLLGYFRPSVTEFIKYVLTGRLVSPYYFIILIWQFYLLAPLFFHLAKKLNPLILCAGAAVLMLFSRLYAERLFHMAGVADTWFLDRFFMSYLFYFVFGCAVGAHYDAVKGALSRMRPALCLTAAWLLLGVYECALVTGRLQLDWRINDTLHTLYCVISITLAFALTMRISACPPPRFVKASDGATYYVYLCHSFFIFMADGVMNRLGIADLFLRLILRCLAGFGISFALCIAYSEIKRRVVKKLKKA